MKQSTIWIEQFDIWVADLNPRIETELGKIRPVLIVQTNFLNKVPHPSTLVCPLTTVVVPETILMRIKLKKGMANLNSDCDIMLDQIRAIDNDRLKKKIGVLPTELMDKAKMNLKAIMDLD